MSRPYPIFKNGIYSSKIASQIRNYLIKKYDIKIKGRFKTGVGRADIENREIWVPDLSTPENFLVNLHEIGHVINGWSDHMHYTEFRAERWTLQFAKKVGFPQDDLRDYEKRARGYVLWWIASEYMDGMRMCRVRSNVRKWLKYDFRKWRNKCVVVNNYWHKKTGYVLMKGPYGRSRKESIFC